MLEHDVIACRLARKGAAELQAVPPPMRFKTILKRL
jgi:hypothetical protein